MSQIFSARTAGGTLVRRCTTWPARAGNSESAEISSADMVGHRSRTSDMFNVRSAAARVSDDELRRSTPLHQVSVSIGHR